MIQQAVLLAAGTGSRLLPLTASCPKCLVKVRGRAIVDTLLDGLKALGIEEIVVVTGYQAEALREYLSARTSFRWRFVDNPRYATTNNILSLQVASESIAAPFVLVESDIYTRPEVMAPLATPDTMIVAPYTADMDGTAITMDAQGRVQEMVIRAHLHRPDSLSEMFKTVNF